MEEKIVYFSFLESTFQKGGGHIETFEEINEFQNMFGNIDVLSVNKYKFSDARKKGQRFFYVKEFNKLIPIFGKRPFVSFKFLSKYKKVIIADSRCLIPFLMAFILRKKIYFKSHGSLAIYFWSYLVANLFIFKFQPLKSFLKIFYYLVLIITFSLIEIFIYIFSNKVYMMRSLESLKLSFWGNLYILFFADKTKFSFCPSVNKYKSMKKINNLKNTNYKDSQIKILIFGNWVLPHNFASLLDFLQRLSTPKLCTLNIVGKINDSQKIIIKRLENKSSLKINIHGYVKKLDEFKMYSTHVVSCANYGSGIPIKSLEIILESNYFNYIPMASKYCQESLKGILNIKKYTFPNDGPINI